MAGRHGPPYLRTCLPTTPIPPTDRPAPS
jgi:hypothetical protein